MHVAHHYALHCGAQLAKPHVPISFYPVPHARYVCICTQGEVTSKKYDYFEEVIDLIHPYLSDQDIPIVHVSDGEERPLKNTVNFGNLTRKHNNYIASNAEALISNDSYCSHVASATETKVVSLFGPLYKNISQPLWGKEENTRFLESHRNGQKPSFKGDEAESKSINLILPEEVGAATLDLLEIKHTLADIKTHHMGKYYHTPVIEVVPTSEPENNIHEGGAINLRLDLAFNPEMIGKWAFNRKLNLLTNQEIDLKSIDMAKPHILQIMIEVNDNISPDYISRLTAGGYNLYLFSKDKESIKDLRFKFIDWDIHLNVPLNKKELDNSDKICDNTYFKTSKTVTANNKQYSTIAHWKKGLESSDQQRIIDSPEFWEEADYFRIYTNNG